MLEISARIELPAGTKLGALWGGGGGPSSIAEYAARGEGCSKRLRERVAVKLVLEEGGT